MGYTKYEASLLIITISFAILEMKSLKIHFGLYVRGNYGRTNNKIYMA